MLGIPVAVAPAVPSGPFERSASSSRHSSVSAPPSPFHSDAAFPRTPFRAKDICEKSQVSASSVLSIKLFIWSFGQCAEVSLFMSHLADGSFILIQIVPELLKLQVSFPQLLLQLPDHRLIALHGWW